ncbi:MAG TPA: Smr/MutS family protein [Longimicrobium sp.]|nr:Smr/MutS family protein [Longimicrobium sp.]
MSRKKKPGQPSGAPREAWGKIHPLLDLHHMTGTEAIRKTEQWLRDRQAEGARTVIVVTGRGLRSPWLPVLRREIEHLLQGLKGTLVASFAAEDFGGSFRVELRRPPPAPPPPAEPALLREADPALRRRAEEALYDLGIAPTPALVEAEIKRILRDEGSGEQV